MKFDQVIESITHDSLERLEHGAVYIEFMKDKEGIKIIAKFDDQSN